MATAETQKPKAPPYTSYGSFTNFIKGLQETGVPSRIDKSVLSKMSGSGRAALVAALKWLELTSADGVPTERLETLVSADAENFGVVLAEMMVQRYPFISDGSLNLAKATGAQVEQKFRDFGIQGSTLSKSVAFFIAAAKDAQIALGPHIKPPKVASSPRKTPRKPADQLDRGDVDDGANNLPPTSKAGFVRIPIPLHGMADGVVYLPDSLTGTQWTHAIKIARFILENYRGGDEGPAAQGEVP